MSGAIINRNDGHIPSDTVGRLLLNGNFNSRVRIAAIANGNNTFEVLEKSFERFKGFNHNN